MKAFSFRLERVLQWRITSLKLEEAKLEVLHQRLDETRRKKEQLAATFQEAKRKSDSQQCQSGWDLQALDAYAGSVKRESAALAGEIQTQEEAAGKQKQAVVECERSVRLLERLRGRRNQEWQGESDREMDSLLDDFSAAQWLRSQ